MLFQNLQVNIGPNASSVRGPLFLRTCKNAGSAASRLRLLKQLGRDDFEALRAALKRDARVAAMCSNVVVHPWGLELSAMAEAPFDSPHSGGASSLHPAAQAASSA